MINGSIDRKINLQGIKAEAILSLEGVSDVLVNTNTEGKQGAFCRNYSPDLIDFDYNTNTVILSRNAIEKQLPEGLFFEEDELKNSSNFEKAYKTITVKKEDRSNFFQPFNTEYFNLSLAFEKEINRISEKSNQILLDLFFEKEEIAKINVPALQILLPQISHIKGNVYLIIDLLKNILDVKKIELTEPDRDCFIIHIPNLSKEQYDRKTEEVEDIFKILKEYFLPFHINYDFKIKDREQKFILGKNLILDYNVNIL